MLYIMQYIDAHFHKNVGFDMAAARAMGLRAMICNGTNEEDWGDVLDIVRDGAYGAIGLHPWYVAAAQPGWDARLTDILTAHPELMVGEIGLDKNRDDLDAQESAFAVQVAIATKLRRPMQIHCVGAWDRLMRVLDGAGRDVPPIIFHAFGGSVDTMNALAKHYDTYFSFSADVENPARVRARKCVAAAPEDRILTETDNGDFIKLPRVVAAIAEMRGTTPDHIAGIVYNNLQRILNYGQTAQDS